MKYAEKQRVLQAMNDVDWLCQESECERGCGLGGCVWVFTARAFLWFNTNLLNELLQGNCPVWGVESVRVWGGSRILEKQTGRWWAVDLCVSVVGGQIWPTLRGANIPTSSSTIFSGGTSVGTGSLCTLGSVWHDYRGKKHFSTCFVVFCVRWVQCYSFCAAWKGTRVQVPT